MAKQSGIELHGVLANVIVLGSIGLLGCSTPDFKDAVALKLGVR